VLFNPQRLTLKITVEVTGWVFVTISDTKFQLAVELFYISLW
jgi:hypothetical protein